jgi:predicted transposase YbfD/YdcC
MEGIILQEHFATLKDPRVERTKRHQLLAIITIALCEVICGADIWVEVEEFGKAKQACFLSWVQAINTVLPTQQMAIDGKTARRSQDHATGRAAIQMVSAWASATHLVLAQRHVDEHSNEKTALPTLLEQLELAGCIISIDATGYQPKIAKQIKEQDGEYVLALKGNQGTLYQEVVGLFADALTTRFADLVHDDYKTVEKGHGRLEIRQYWTTSDPDCIAYLNAEQL